MACGAGGELVESWQAKIGGGASDGTLNGQRAETKKWGIRHPVLGGPQGDGAVASCGGEGSVSAELGFAQTLNCPTVT